MLQVMQILSTDPVPFLSNNLCEVSEPLYAVSSITAREDASDSRHYLLQARLLRRTSGGVLLQPRYRTVNSQWGGLQTVSGVASRRTECRHHSIEVNTSSTRLHSDSDGCPACVLYFVFEHPKHSLALLLRVVYQ
jgi:hypothetical protein